MKIIQKIMMISMMVLIAGPAFALYSYEGINFLGTVRNDFYYMKPDNEHSYNNILEARLVVDREADEEKATDWKIYFDGRGYVYAGDITEETGSHEFRFMRGFARVFSTAGYFTLGKTYINFGNPGLFNPFETDKEVNLRDLNYDREGMPALEYLFPISGSFEGRVYAGSDNHFNYTAGGGSLRANAGGFDFGIIANRLNPDSSIAGLYFKGDIFIGIQGAYGCHLDGDYSGPFSEATLGIDYSFFRGALIVETKFYYNENGASDQDEYIQAGDSFLLARYYQYGSVIFIYDEFLNGQVFCIANLNDGSTILSPIINAVIIDGVTLTLQVSFLTGKEMEEFSRDIWGDYTAMARVEGRF